MSEVSYRWGGPDETIVKNNAVPKGYSFSSIKLDDLLSLPSFYRVEGNYKWTHLYLKEDFGLVHILAFTINDDHGVPFLHPIGIQSPFLKTYLLTETKWYRPKTLQPGNFLVL